MASPRREPGRTRARRAPATSRRPRRRRSAPAPRRSRSASTPPTRSAVRPPVGRADAIADAPGPRGRARRRRRARAGACRRCAIGPPRRLPVTTVPAALDREHPVDREPRRGRTLGDAGRRPTRAASAPISRPRHRSPRPSAPDATSTGDPASDVARAARRPRRRPRPRRASSAQVRLRHDREPVADAERVEQLQVLERLGVRPVVGRDDQQRGVDLARPDEHVADQPVVPRHVDEVDHAARRGSARCAYPTSIVMPAPPLLGEAIGVDPGERAEQRRLAVVDVAGRADDELAAGRAASSATGDGAAAIAAEERIVVRGLDRAEVERRPRRARSARPPPGRRPGAAPGAGRARPTAARRRATAASRRAATRRRPSPRSRRRVAIEPTAPATDDARAARSSTDAAICRQTGISRTATPARYSPSVAATAARITLSGRIARASGSRAQPRDEVGAARRRTPPAARRRACRR